MLACPLGNRLRLNAHFIEMMELEYPIVVSMCLRLHVSFNIVKIHHLHTCFWYCLLHFPLTLIMEIASSATNANPEMTMFCKSHRHLKYRKMLSCGKLIIVNYYQTLIIENWEVSQVLLIIICNSFSIFGWAVCCFFFEQPGFSFTKSWSPVNFLAVWDNWKTTTVLFRALHIKLY